jgi:hypothetical protein
LPTILRRGRSDMVRPARRSRRASGSTRDGCAVGVHTAGVYEPMSEPGRPEPISHEIRIPTSPRPSDRCPLSDPQASLLLFYCCRTKFAAFSKIRTMARIRSLEPGEQSIRAHDTEVDCFYQTVMTSDGTKLLHLSTFGSDDRQSQPKSSQSIQIDAAIAGRLIEILEDAFPGRSA